jgi:hypothetical protein
MTDQTLTPSRLWKRMTSAKRLEVARAFWLDEQATNDHLQAVLYISQQKKFRPKTVVGLDEERKSRHLASLANLPDSVVARALVAYHLAEQRPMMGAFLDALGIAHENGLIQDEGVAPDPVKVGPAASKIAQEFPEENVSLYLNTLLCQDPGTWGLLADVPQRQS